MKHILCLSLTFSLLSLAACTQKEVLEEPAQLSLQGRVAEGMYQTSCEGWDQTLALDPARIARSSRTQVRIKEGFFRVTSVLYDDENCDRAFARFEGTGVLQELGNTIASYFPERENQDGFETIGYRFSNVGDVLTVPVVRNVRRYRAWLRSVKGTPLTRQSQWLLNEFWPCPWKEDSRSLSWRKERSLRVDPRKCGVPDLLEQDQPYSFWGLNKPSDVFLVEWNGLLLSGWDLPETDLDFEDSGLFGRVERAAHALTGHRTVQASGAVLTQREE